MPRRSFGRGFPHRRASRTSAARGARPVVSRVARGARGRSPDIVLHSCVSATPAAAAVHV
jgi:hypothetical protein